MRPAYHYAPAANWLSDPNGLVHHAGEWHMFYQYNPEGEDWGHMSWGHAVSTDLARWQELPVALREDAQHAIFSGSAVIDADNRAGLGAGAMIALYTGMGQGAEARQVQCLASSTDNGRSWSKLAANPVLDRGLADFRDPNVFWHAPTRRWIMVVALSAENRALLYASNNLRDWHEISAIAGEGAPGRVWECPLLIELPVAGGGLRWLFKVDALHDAPGSGALYCTGSFDGTEFVPDGDGWRLADEGSDFYAAIAWHAPRDAGGRPVWIGWMGNHGYQGRLPRQGWRGAMSLPRRIWLRREDGVLRLCQEVEGAAVAGVAVAAPGAGRIAMASALDLPVGRSFALTLDDGAGRRIEIAAGCATLRVSRRDAVSPFLDHECKVPLPGRAPLRLWLDAGSIEILGDDGALSLTMQHRMAGDAVALDWR